MNQSNEEERPANKKYGYKFGCDGVVDYKEAMYLLAVKTRETVAKMAENGLDPLGSTSRRQKCKSDFLSSFNY